MILVVHSDKNLRHFLTSMIKDRLDHPVFSADSAREMIWHLKKIFFDLILISPELEDGSGMDLIRSIRKTHNRFKLPVILIASSTRQDTIVSGFEMGINDCITVPLDPMVALARIRSQIQLVQEHRHLLAKVTSSPTASMPNAEDSPSAANSAPAQGGLAAAVQAGLAPEDTVPPAGTVPQDEEEALAHEEIVDLDSGSLSSIDMEAIEDGDPEPGSLTTTPTQTDHKTRTEPISDNLATLGDAPSTGGKNIEDLMDADKQPDQPIPCEMPVSLYIGARSFFCKTLWMTRKDMLVLTFEDFPKESRYQVQLLDPKGGTVDVTVTETQRQSLDDRGAGVMKLNLKILSAPEGFDDLYHLFAEAFQTDGVAGLKAVLRGEEVSSSDFNIDDGEEEKFNQTIAFSSAAASLNVIKGTRYKFEKQVGRGGFASVYLVKDKALKRQVAMKVLNHDFSKVDTARGNFLCEAQIAAQFHHPNIVFVYEVGELFKNQYEQHLEFPSPILSSHPDRLIYFTMQYVEGKTLTQWIRGKNNEEEANCIQVMVEIVRALSFAHGKGVIHRDIKPDNIMITPEGHVLVTDFGIATLTKSEPDPAPEATKKGGKVEIACTPKYASPEQLRGKTLDGRSDIYSFGILAYEMLTGRPPFRGGSISEIVGKQLKMMPRPINETRPEVMAQLEEIIFRCLAKKPEERPQADELLDILEEIREPGSTTSNVRTMTETLDELIAQAIMIKAPSEGARVLEQLTALLQLQKTYDNVEHIREIKQKLTEASLLNLLIEHNLNNDNQQLLYEFFMALDSSAAVMKILQWFRKEKEHWKKLVLGELAVLSAGRDLVPLAHFGLELNDDDACVLLKGFGEIATQTQDPIFFHWAHHQGIKTQRELLKIVNIANRPEAEVTQILEYYAEQAGTRHKEIHLLATRILAERQRIMA